MDFPFSRRRWIQGALAVSGLALLPHAAHSADSGNLRFGPKNPFSFALLKARAEALAHKPYEPARIRAADQIYAVDYDAYAHVRFRQECDLWADEPDGPAIAFFHVQRYAREPVTISAVENGLAREIIYSPSYFDIPDDSPARKVPRDIGFAGFRVMNLNQKGDWLAFMGASYFRSAGASDQYGLSARGLAIDTAIPGPEEFPRFSDFWLERADGGELIVYALLNGPSVAGAYRITARKTPDAVLQDVEAAVYVRRPVTKLGFAPLTSMFWYGENNREAARDWRPEIHDSDGLAIATGSGERIWRPLANPPRVMTNAFLDTNPKGFGLSQRDRAFSSYEDDGVFYNRRPCLWVEPMNQWGAGSVQLVEIPTEDEINDNIVAFWVPDGQTHKGQTFDLTYRLHWRDDEPMHSELAHVVSTRVGMGGHPGTPRPPGVRKFVIDWAGPVLKGLTRESGIEQVITVSRGEIANAVIYPVQGRDTWRSVFDILARGSEPVDLKVYAHQGDRTVSETWVYQYFP